MLYGAHLSGLLNSLISVMESTAVCKPFVKTLSSNLHITSNAEKVGRKAILWIRPSTKKPVRFLKLSEMTLSWL